ncbi:hypothetical protein ACIQI7_09325 [Kitasatospora sp. NPDC092039]|uniref:hypothetical protein n=1 Tax=Kitasatospora sp. NPDC092039 TaxID=3364086 RepID=UPI003809706E
MPNKREVNHIVRTAWSTDQVADRGLGALRQTVLEDLIRSAHCSLNGTGDVRITIETDEWGTVGRGHARCSDPLCVDLVAAHRRGPSDEPKPPMR